MVEPLRKRLLLLLPTSSYRADGFVDAAIKLGLDLTVVSEQPHSVDSGHPADYLTTNFADRDGALNDVRAFVEEFPVAAVIGVDDSTAVLAAEISEALGLPSNPTMATRAARDKAKQRRLWAEAGVSCPGFGEHSVTDEVSVIAEAAPYPCILKPVTLSAGRGVIRANDSGEFLRAHERLCRILKSDHVVAPADQRFLVEEFISGPEFALEGLIVDGGLHVLAIFDKPDPMDGPFFQETIYVTPSRAEQSVRNSLVDCAGRAAAALGLERGSVHAEFRVSNGRPYVIEFAARPIGGKCSRVLRFGDDGKSSLEELLLRHATGVLTEVPSRENAASGVMMIPIPRAGVLEKVAHVEEAQATSGITEILITAHRGQEIVPPPEGSQYLGFIFARAEQPEVVEEALRVAHDKLDIQYR